MKNVLLIGDSIRMGYDKSVKASLQGIANVVFPNAKVIFATSTSVQSEKMGGIFKRYNEDIEKYNDVSVEIVKKYGFEVNDLYSLSTSLPEDAHSDSVHFYTEIGTKTLTNQVLSYICEALDVDIVTYVEDLYKDAPIGI